MIVTTVTIWVKTEHLRAFIKATKNNHLAAIQEPGNLRFDVSQCSDDPGRFLLYEAYESEAAARAHKETSHYLQWRDTVSDWMLKPREGIKHNILFPSDKNLW